MLKINLNEVKKYEIKLWLKDFRIYKYFFSEKDRIEYLTFLRDSDLNNENFIKIFEKFFKKHNKNVFIEKYDIFWLFNFFNSIFL